MGLLGFYRGIVLSFVKIEIQTIITFVLIEKMRLHYGLMPKTCANEKEAIFKDCIMAKKPEVVKPPPGYFDRLWRIRDALRKRVAEAPRLSFFYLLKPFVSPPPPEPEPPIVEEEVVETHWMKAKKRLNRRLRKLGRRLLIIVYKSLEKHHKENDVSIEIKKDEEFFEEDDEKAHIPKMKRTYDHFEKEVEELEEEEESEQDQK